MRSSDVPSSVGRLDPPLGRVESSANTKILRSIVYGVPPMTWLPTRLYCYGRERFVYLQ